MGLLAQSYRDLYERVRISVKHAENPALAAPVASAKGTRRGSKGGKKGVTTPAPPPKPRGGPLQPEEMAAVRRALRLLLDRQGDLGRQLTEVTRHRLFLAGGEEPRKIMVRLNEFGTRCLGLRLSSESMVQGTERAVMALLDDLSEINSKACEDFQRYGYNLKSRGDGILSGRKEDRRFLQGDSWRRSWAY